MYERVAINFLYACGSPGMLGFRLQPNPGAERQATVTLRSTAAGINIEKSFTVVQAANTNSLSFLSPASGRIDLAASDNGFTVDLSTNLNREEITVDGLAYWLGVAEKSDIANGVRVRLSADENDGGTRSHTITFYGGGLSLNLPVNQSAVAGLVPTLSLRSPASGKVPLGAYPENFTVVLATNMSPDDIEAGAFPAWLTAAAPEHGNGTVTWNFTAEANPGKARDAVLTFSVEGLPTVSVTVSQSEPGLPGKPVSPTEAVYYDHSINGHDAYETIDGDKSVYLTLPATSVWGYEFRFPFDTDLTAIIYYPRDSETSHGTFKKIEIRVVCHEGGTPVESYTVEIPPSLYASAASRRAGFLINLPFTARLASHLRIIPAEGYQENYSIAEIEFFGPE